MKSELEYLMLALNKWCSANVASKHLPVTAASMREVLVIAAAMRQDDADKLEQPKT